jgi:hypothetical protein
LVNFESTGNDRDITECVRRPDEVRLLMPGSWRDADAWFLLPINVCQYQSLTCIKVGPTRAIPRYRYRSIGAVPDLEQERAWEHFSAAGGTTQRKGVWIDPRALREVFLIKSLLL